MKTTYRSVGSAALGALAVTTGAHGAAGLGDKGTYQPNGAEFCSTADDAAAVTDASVWTCLVPNGSGGLALVSNVPTKAGTGYPDTAALKTQFASGAKAIVIGDATTSAAGAQSLAIGSNARVLAIATDGIAIGTGAYVQGAGSTSIGLNANNGAGITHSVAIGTNSRNEGNSSIAIGHSARTPGGTVEINAIAIGSDARGYAEGVAIGTSANADQAGFTAANGGIAIGNRARTEDESTRGIAIGNGATVGATSGSADAPMAIGANARATRTNALAIGTGAIASGERSISIGTGNVVSGDRSGALGDPTTITGIASYAIGNDNTLAADNAFVFGNNVTVAAGLNGAVVLGNNSSVAASNPTASVTLGATTYNFAGAAPAAGAVVSVGAPGAERQLTHLAAGRIGATSTDAVNGSQLFATNAAIGVVGTALTNLGGSTATHLGGGAAYDPVTGNIGAPTYNVYGSAQTTVGGAIQALQNNAPLQFTTSGTPTTNDVTLVGPVSGAPVALHNVAAGAVTATSTDAVNGAQLFATNAAITNIVSGGGVKYFHTNSSAADSSAAGAQSVAIGPQAVAIGTGAVAIGDRASAQADGSVAIGASAVATRGAESYSGAYSAAPNASVGTVSIGSAGAERTLSNVADGRLATDAVTLRQLDGAMQQATAYTDTRIASLNVGAASLFQVNNSANLPAPTTAGPNSIAGGAGASASGTGATALGNGATANANNAVALGAASVADRDNTVSVGAAGAERQIVNLAPGTAGTDAVNVNQLNAGLQSVQTQANAYTDQRVNQLSTQMHNVARNAYAGVASAMAVQMPASYVPGKTVLRVGSAVFRGEAAVGVSFRRTAENNAWSITGGVGTSRAGTAATAGVEWVFN